jgi:hypothetical protein
MSNRLSKYLPFLVFLDAKFATFQGAMRSGDKLVESLDVKLSSSFTDAPRKHHTWGIRHRVKPIRDVRSAGRRESVAEARHRCGFGEAPPLMPREIHG